MSRVPTEGTKLCRRCGETRPVAEFRTFRPYGRPDKCYRRSWCRACDIAYVSEWRARHPGYHARWSRRYRAL